MTGETSNTKSNFVPRLCRTEKIRPTIVLVKTSSFQRIIKSSMIFSTSSDICDPRSSVANWILCPTRPCDANYCGFTRVLDTCGLYRWTSAATFDRPGAVVFAIFMSFWGESQRDFNYRLFYIYTASEVCSE